MDEPIHVMNEQPTLNTGCERHTLPNIYREVISLSRDLPPIGVIYMTTLQQQTSYNRLTKTVGWTPKATQKLTYTVSKSSKLFTIKIYNITLMNNLSILITRQDCQGP